MKCIETGEGAILIQGSPLVVAKTETGIAVFEGNCTEIIPIMERLGYTDVTVYTCIN